MALAHLDRLVGGDEDVDVARHPRPVGEPSADEQVEADGAVVEAGRPQADVVDLGLGAVVAAARDAELELPRQVGVLPVAGEEVRDLASDRRCVEDLVGVDAGDRAAEDVAGRVPARLHRRDPDLLEQGPDLGHVSDPDPVQLDVLAGREVAVAVAPDRMVLRPAGESVDDLTDPARLRWRSSGLRAPSPEA